MYESGTDNVSSQKNFIGATKLNYTEFWNIFLKSCSNDNLVLGRFKARNTSWVAWALGAPGVKGGFAFDNGIPSAFFELVLRNGYSSKPSIDSAYVSRLKLIFDTVEQDRDKVKSMFDQNLEWHGWSLAQPKPRIYIPVSGNIRSRSSWESMIDEMKIIGTLLNKFLPNLESSTAAHQPQFNALETVRESDDARARGDA